MEPDLVRRLESSGLEKVSTKRNDHPWGNFPKVLNVLNFRKVNSAYWIFQVCVLT
jgi:hypothetical protein